MTLEDLAERLSNIENAEAARAAEAEQKGFIDKYGAMFSGDEGIGMAILAEMNRRGISSAAVGADRAVQEILDQIREEATMVLDKIKADRDTVNELIDEVQDVQEAVSAALGEDMSTGGNGVVEEPDVDAALDEELPPLPPEGEEPLPPEGEEPLPPEGEEPLPPEGEEPLPPLPNTVVSDAAVKKVIPFKVKPRVKHSSEPKGWKPASHLLDAIKGGK